METILSITGPEPVRSGEYPDHYQVGHGGVTKIEEATENCGTYGIIWFRVMMGNHLVAKMNGLHVANICYQTAI